MAETKLKKQSLDIYDEDLSLNGSIILVDDNGGVTHTSESGSPSYIAYSYSSTLATDAFNLNAFRARNTLATPQAINSGDDIMLFVGYGYDGTGFASAGAMIVEAGENWSGTNKGGNIYFQTTKNGATSNIEYLRLSGAGEVVINEPGNDLNFRAEGVSNTHALFVQASTDRVRVGAETGGFGAFNVIGSSGSTSSYYVDTATASTSNLVQHVFSLKNSIGGEHTYGAIRFQPETITDGAEDGKMSIRLSYNGGVTESFLTMSTTETTFNESGYDVDFRVEGVGEANAIFVQGSNGFVGLGYNQPNQRLHLLGNVRQVQDDNGTSSYYLESYSSTSAFDSPVFVSKRARGSYTTPSAISSSDRMGTFSIQGYNGSAFATGASIRFFAGENWVASTNQGTIVYFAGTPDGSASEEIYMSYENSVVTIDENNNGIVFRVNSGLQIKELSADPSDPPEGHCVIWQSDGTGTGDDGDVMIKITAGATTKTTTLVDFSTI